MLALPAGATSMTGWLAQLLLVASGGWLGGMARFWISGMVARRFGETFPWGTLVVNVTGSAAIGVLAGVLTARGALLGQTMPVWTLLALGVLGSYTTVSSFSLQTLALLRGGETRHALLNVMGSVAACLAAAAAGYGAVLTALSLE